MSRLTRLLLAALLAATALSARAEIIDVDNAELARLMAAGVPVIDVRTAGEWEETGIVPGSRLLTYFDDNGKADPPAWLAKAQAYAKAGQPVAVICRSGNRTKAVSRYLSQEAGYAKVYNVKGGIKAWIAEGRPTAPAAQPLAACRADKTC
ncbi:MAG: rhodanese-like domain-containing protein [Azonexus sp.]|jgi:rhodanese-related sulfurtransferase|nr:rhodanese-like domain-containing protein [Betaproteobacteria bacterium]MBK8918258.1 rhodanese-like domain-containing protein [Betaproteobacteria bacterium]MBP6036192.1 rhodanese-like domain-containing protein [Azonexus sp.]MBP6906715.1 rhodanese-like domain-containing protein [Azonexus sp.]